MIYIHVPFCRSFCVYCDFYSEIACKSGVFRYVDELCSEIESRRPEMCRTLGVNTLYFGGGTPSVLPVSALERIVGCIGAGEFREFTVEVNPDDIVQGGEDYVRSLVRLGVNRISMGVQSLDDDVLRWMRRRHDAAAARQAYGILRRGGVGNISVDIIFGISLLSDSTLTRTLDEICSDWRPEHISAYQLCIEEGSALAAMRDSGAYTEASEEACAGQYDIICRTLGSAGYRHYEISNWAIPGFEAVHNSAYWTRHPYVGFGPGAHSFDGSERSWNSCAPSGWTRTREELGPAEQREEEIMLGLRMAEGIPCGLCNQQALHRAIADGTLVDSELTGYVRIPESRFFVSDDIISDLL